MTWPTKFDCKLGDYNPLDLPGQQLAAAQAPIPLDHVLKLDIKAPPGCQRLTGIMASMGRSTYDVELLQKMMEAGMNIAFLNMSFGTWDEHTETIKMLRDAAKNFGDSMGRTYPLGIAISLAGRKIKTGRIADIYGDTVELKVGEAVRLTTDETYKDRCSTYTIYVDFMYLADQLKKGNTILLDNELILLKVDVISSTTLTCSILRGGFLGSYKDVFIPNVVLDMPNYTEKDKQDIEMAVTNEVDLIIASFVNSASNVTELRNLLGEKGRKIGIIANIQTSEGYRNFDQILEVLKNTLNLQVADGIMITRQELGSDITPKKLVLAQKNMIARANRANVPVCVSAHLLSSMRYNRIPLRAELLDVSNCILDGADCLVLCPETAVGLYPVETVACMDGACKEAEACIWSKQCLLDFIDKTLLPCDQVTGAAMAAVLAAQRALATAIIVVSTTGKSAQLVARYRPRCPILIITRYPVVSRQMHLWRGLIPLVYEGSPQDDWSEDLENRVNFGLSWAIDIGFVRIGDPVVIVCGWKQGTGNTNTMRVMYAAPPRPTQS